MHDNQPLILHMSRLSGDEQMLLKAEGCLVVPFAGDHRITCPPGTMRRHIGLMIEIGYVRTIPNYTSLEFPSHRRMLLRRKIGHGETFTIIDPNIL